MDKMTAALLRWYEENKRDLPWRGSKEPYLIWLSEVMAQQTRIAALLPYYERFTARFPDVYALARAEEAEVLKVWEGLGYYTRARMLHKAARMVAHAHGGVFPKTAAGLLALPGIGEYTAGAIAAICYNEAVPAVDGNALRVFARIRNDDADIMLADTKKRLTAYLTERMPPDAGVFNQAVMELGALVCVPGNPRCTECPVAAFCEGKQNGREKELPVKSKKKARRVLDVTVLVVANPVGEILVRRREERLLQGLWEFVLAEGQTEPEAVMAGLGLTCLEAVSAGAAVHVFTHLEWHMTGWRCQAAEADAPEGYQFVPLAVLRELALPSALAFYWRQML